MNRSGERGGACPPPVNHPYFPAKHQAVVFRNWGSIPAEALAELLETTAANVRACAREMGLEADAPVDGRWLSRGYITLIRQNWHLLCEEQLLHLLGWTKERLAFSLKEDDFLDYKLGHVKPDCAWVRFRELSRAEAEETARIREAVQRAPARQNYAPFSFLDALEAPEIPARREAREVGPGEVALNETWGIDSQGFGGALDFAIERFRGRVSARWGLSLRGAERLIRVARGEFPGAMRETHRLCIDEKGILIESVDAPGAMRGLTELEEIFERAGAPAVRPGEIKRTPRFETRVLYPYAAVFGDAFIEADCDPLPEGLLDRLMRAGVNGVWLHMVLYQMVPFPFDPALSSGWETRILTLNRFIERAERYGIGVYLYVNEPRALPNAFFEKHPALAGHTDGEFTCMCTSHPKTQGYLRDAMRTLFERAPKLAGAFTITMSENRTNCFSRSIKTNCPVCAKRPVHEVTSEVNRVIAEGVYAAKPDAALFFWNWAWRASNGYPDEVVAEAVGRLPARGRMLSTSEMEMDFAVGGIAGKVGDYTMSIPGPGARAKRFWREASSRGMRCAAKIQVNNSWECAAVPYLPVMDLVLEHMDNLSKENVTDLFLSWTLGGYPSQNLQRVSRYFWNETTDIAEESPVSRAQSIFSEAFRSFPFSVDTLYFAPQNIGPANPLLPSPSGYEATMVGFPYDDLKKWRNMYPVDVFEAQFQKLYVGWAEGVRYLEAHAPGEAELMGIARAALNHFESVYWQIRYVRLRDGGGAPEEISKVVRRALEIVHAQIQCIDEDARIGFEASNHYFYTRQTLLEAAVACEYLLRKYGQSGKGGRE